MKCLVRFKEGGKRFFGIDYEDFQVGGALLRTIYRPNNAGKRFDRKAKRLVKDAYIMGSDGNAGCLWLALNNICGILKKVGGLDIIVFLGSGEQAGIAASILSKWKNVAIVVEQEHIERVESKLLDGLGAACVFPPQHAPSFKGKTVVLMPGVKGVNPLKAKAVVNLSGNAMGCRGEILPGNIHFKPPRMLEEACAKWGGDAETLAAFIGFFDLSPKNLHIFSIN